MQNQFNYEKPFKAVCLTTPGTFAIKEYVYEFHPGVDVPLIFPDGVIVLPAKEADWENFVVLKVQGCGICSTDTHMYQGKRFLYEKAGDDNVIIPGHELFGQVIWGHDKYSHLMGKDVVVDPVIDCFKEPRCGYCQEQKNYMHVPFLEMGICGRVPGGFAQFAVALAKNCYTLDKPLTIKEKALVEPLATVLYALRDILKLDPQPRTHLIIGSGNIGLLALQCIKLLNPKNFVALIDQNDVKLNLAKKLGADAVIGDELSHIDAIRAALSDMGKPDGFNVVMEMSGSDAAINLIPHVSAKCAQVLLYGLGHKQVTIDQFDLFIEKELKIVSSLGASNQYRFQEAIDLIPVFESERIISHAYNFDTIGEIFSKAPLDKNHIKGVFLP